MCVRGCRDGAFDPVTTLGSSDRTTKLAKQGAGRLLPLLQFCVLSLQWKERVLPGALECFYLSPPLEQGSSEAEPWGWVGAGERTGVLASSPGTLPGSECGHRDLHFDSLQTGLQSGPDAQH